VKNTIQVAYICDEIRRSIGRDGGPLCLVRADNLATIPITALMDLNLQVDWAAVNDVIYGCASQAGESNRNVVHRSKIRA